MRVIILGTRGSASVCGKEYDVFGESTTSILLQTPDRTILLDAGSGILHMPSGIKQIDLLMTHVHLDHLLGLPMCKPMFDPECRVRMLTMEVEQTQAALDRMVSPPLWPVRIPQLPASFTLEQLPEKTMLGDVSVTSVYGTHPGWTTLIRLEYKGKSFVMATDHEPGSREHDEALVRLAEDADLILMDGQYTPAEYPSKKGFGHGTWEMCLKLAKESRVKHLLIGHHDPFHNDGFLLEMEKDLKTAAAQLCPDMTASLAREGEIFAL